MVTLLLKFLLYMFNIHDTTQSRSTNQIPLRTQWVESFDWNVPWFFWIILNDARSTDESINRLNTHHVPLFLPLSPFYSSPFLLFTQRVTILTYSRGRTIDPSYTLSTTNKRGTTDDWDLSVVPVEVTKFNRFNWELGLLGEILIAKVTHTRLKWTEMI